MRMNEINPQIKRSKCRNNSNYFCSFVNLTKRKRYGNRSDY
nr:MAG TPA: hypothetical protein [Bacteriophage sp.]